MSVCRRREVEQARTCRRTRPRCAGPAVGRRGMQVTGHTIEGARRDAHAACAGCRSTSCLRWLCLDDHGDGSALRPTKDARARWRKPVSVTSPAGRREEGADRRSCGQARRRRASARDGRGGATRRGRERGRPWCESFGRNVAHAERARAGRLWRTRNTRRRSRTAAAAGCRRLFRTRAAPNVRGRRVCGARSHRARPRRAVRRRRERRRRLPRLPLWCLFLSGEERVGVDVEEAAACAPAPREDRAADRQGT